MRFGTFQLQSIPPWSDAHTIARNHFAQMLGAEEHGFDAIWLAEHNARDYAMLGNTAALVTALAAVTKRVNIATAVVRLPLHHPLHIAEDLAYADVISNGRVYFGVGKGYDELEFESYGAPFEEREGRWEEAFRAIRQIWATGSTAFEGTYYNFAEAKLLPPPIQQPGPKTFVMVSGSERSLAYAAEQLLPVAFSSGPSADELREKQRRYWELASGAGHADDDIAAVLEDCWQLKPMFVGETRRHAIDVYRDGMEWYMGALANRSMFGFSKEKQPIEYYAEHGNVLLGSADEMVERLAEYSERSGISNFICWINMGGAAHEEVMASLERFGSQVIPQLAETRASAVRV